jgi:hypothetical protein
MMQIRKTRWLRIALGIGMIATQAQAAGPLNITKTMRTVSDPLANTFPRNIPGAVIDYSITVENPLFNGGAPSPELIDSIPKNTELRVDDLPLLSAVSFLGGIPIVSDLLTLAAGPVDFQGTTLLNVTGLTYTFTSLSSDTDTLSFSSDNRKTWTYTPVRNADGYDPAVTDIRLKFNTTQRAGSNYSLRFRVRLR